MLKEPAPQQYQFEMVTLEELVPEDHLVRKIDAAIDVEFIRDTVVNAKIVGRFSPFLMSAIGH
ncbi:hypothetical protein [Brenneria rubrifaciens]|uniref:IS5/IS1182 family transposase n=1 Tax=Brenneria rubrifaciens TaxID=55213 RepID=A0A4P8QLV6_9GAMM|nr:hypothetical protein [Brenneria rubrifaciens]QCR07236.1 hypothetical protein EH207_00895 [Brenneria rubrifaciens]